MNYEQLKEAIIDHAPANHPKLQNALRYIEEVESNAQHIAPELYNPKKELHAYLSTYFELDREGWITPILDQLLEG